MVMLLVLMASGQRRRGQLGLFLERAGTKRARVASDFSRALALLRIPTGDPWGFLLHSLPLWTRNTRKCTTSSCVRGLWGVHSKNHSLDEKIRRRRVANATGWSNRQEAVIAGAARLWNMEWFDPNLPYYDNPRVGGGVVIKMDVSTKHADAGPAAAFASSYLRSPCIKLNGVVVRGRIGCLRGPSVSHLLLRTLGKAKCYPKAKCLQAQSVVWECPTAPLRFFDVVMRSDRQWVKKHKQGPSVGVLGTHPQEKLACCGATGHLKRHLKKAGRPRDR